MENNSLGKSDANPSERPVTNLMPATLPYSSNVAAMCYPTAQQSLSSPLGTDGNQPTGNYLVPPSMTSPSSCLSTQQMYSNYPSPYYRSMLTAPQQSGNSAALSMSSYYGTILPPGHSSAFYGSFYNPNSSSVYPSSGQPPLNMNYYSPSLYMQPASHEAMWPSNNSSNSNTTSTAQSTAPDKRPYSYETGSSTGSNTLELPPSCSKVLSAQQSSGPALLPGVQVESSSLTSNATPSLHLVGSIEKTSTSRFSTSSSSLPVDSGSILPSISEVTTTEPPASKDAAPSDGFLPSAMGTTEQQPSSRPNSKADETIESLDEASALEKERSDVEEEELEQEEADEEEEIEEEEDEEEDSSSYASSSSSYTESFISDDDLPPIGNEHDLLENVPESILNDTSFGDIADHAKEDHLVDDELQCLLCNNFDHLIPRLDIAIKLEPVVGEPISKSSVLLCTQCDLMLERYLSLEKEVQHLQAQIQTMYQSNKQLAGHHDAGKETDSYCHQRNHAGEGLCLEPGNAEEMNHPISSLDAAMSATETDSTAPASQQEHLPPQLSSVPGQSIPEEPSGAATQQEPLKSHQCKECGKQYSSQRGLQRHSKSHQKAETPCELCDQIFESPAARKAHHKLVHVGAESTNTLLQCSECSRSFEKRSNYLYHVKVHHSPREHKCSVCHKGFATLPALTTHSRIHSGEKPFACQTCGREFNVKSNLVAHVALCNGTFKHRCDQCNKGFATRSLYQIHMKIHQGEYPMKCDTCGMGFVKKSHLVAHQRTHTKEKPYQCPVCGKAFASLGNCNSHAKTHADERKFVCEICGSKFARKQALETHLNRHTGTKPYNCDRCDKSFHDASNLANHKKTHRTTD